MDFRNSLKEISENDSSKLVEILSELNIEKFTKIQNWGDCLRLAFYDLRFPFLQTEILSNWLPILNDNIHFADWILFYFARYLSENNETRKAWISKCIEVAVKSQDESLTESLIWTLRSKIENFDGLFESIEGLKTYSPKINRAFGEIS